MSEKLEKIQLLMPLGKLQEVNGLVESALQEGISPQEILKGGLLEGMDIVAKKWAEGTAFIPEVLISARCMNGAMEILEPYLVKKEEKFSGRVVFGTVQGDLHDIGKNLCTLMLKAKSFEVIDIGVDVCAEKFVEAVKTYQPDVLCMSSLLTTSMGYFKVVLDALQEAGVRDCVKVAIGGAPVTQAYADEIGADLFTEDAVSLAGRLLEEFA
ncbi:corrinoid protein [[Clostridium] innocuum]|nr:corrinoid protein [Erysipelotrichaceae bacterium]MCR0382072.1 corrinoid protein [[Clostridium] innocuum]MCR0413392.1 corrinoid protein [[Clostridium] innocuum]MCR0535745.1 corrinoid protein [[Clostridium] innocuum]MCR0539781.1 corrinoid protein [[Clostridium] innocuum]